MSITVFPRLVPMGTIILISGCPHMRALFEGEHYTGAGTISFRSSRTHWNYCMQWNVSCSLHASI